METNRPRATNYIFFFIGIDIQAFSHIGPCKKEFRGQDFISNFYKFLTLGETVTRFAQSCFFNLIVNIYKYTAISEYDSLYFSIKYRLAKNIQIIHYKKITRALSY